MTKRTTLFAILVLVLSTVMPLHAQGGGGFGGCVDSPENPTLILAGLAGGAFVVSSLRTRLGARRSSKKSLK